MSAPRSQPALLNESVSAGRDALWFFGERHSTREAVRSRIKICAYASSDLMPSVRFAARLGLNRAFPGIEVGPPTGRPRPVPGKARLTSALVRHPRLSGRARAERSGVCAETLSLYPTNIKCGWALLGACLHQGCRCPLARLLSRSQHDQGYTDDDKHSDTPQVPAMAPLRE